jgi:amino acid transporter
VRRSIGRARFLVLLGALIALVGVALPWVTYGEGVVLTPIQGNGFDGAGILVFVACVLLLGLLTLPYASKTGNHSLDRPLSYLALAGVGVAGLLIQLAGFLGSGHIGFPDHAPGLWLAGGGLFVICWGVGELLGERPSEF